MQLEWPPTYTIKRSQRAKRMSLKIESMLGLQVVLPMRASEKHVEPFIEQSREWIEKHLPKAMYNPTNQAIRALPTSLMIRAFDQTWSIDYVKAAGPVRLLVKPDEELVLMGDIDNKPACRDKLRQWLRKRARTFLTERITQLSQKINLPFNNLSIRDQKTRWGSCCINKHISLNYKLIFLPIDVVDYVIIHELCHTVHLNHSANFWGLVESFLVNYKQLKKQANQENHYLPGWLKIN